MFDIQDKIFMAFLLAATGTTIMVGIAATMIIVKFVTTMI